VHRIEFRRKAENKKLSIEFARNKHYRFPFPLVYLDIWQAGWWEKIVTGHPMRVARHLIKCGPARFESGFCANDVISNVAFASRARLKYYH